MLVIGHQADNNEPSYAEIDLDIDTDSPRKIHDALSKKKSGVSFDYIICVEGDEVVAVYVDQDDYDLTVSEEDDDSWDADSDSDDEDPDLMDDDFDDDE